MTTEESVIRAFSAEHVARLAGLSQRQLSYWDQTGFFSPQYAFENRRSPYSRIYSFRDVVGLRTISILRKKYRIPLQNLRKAAEELSRHKNSPWSDLQLYVFNSEVHFREPDSGRVRGVKSAQYVNLPLRAVIEDLAEKSNQLLTRQKDQLGRVNRHRFVAHNAWVVAGTRIPISAVVSFHKEGYSAEQIVGEYPMLTVTDVDAALKHAEKLTKAA
jgi:DNA-binding transcriptional MerR regulator